MPCHRPAGRAPSNSARLSLIPRPTSQMSSKTSKARCPTSVKTEVVVIPTIPQEIIDEILDHLATDSDFGSRQSSLQSCALVSKSWVPSCRRHLFHTIHFALMSMTRWLETFPVPEESPARHVRHLHFWIGHYDGVPENFFKYTPWFTNAEKVALQVDERFRPLPIPSFWRLPQSVTSLTISGSMVTLPQVQKVMVQLPNLNNLVLSGVPAPMDRRALAGIGTVLRGGFGGELRLLGAYVGWHAVDMLLEIPTGLRFTEVRVEDMRSCLLSTVRLAEACSETLVKLSYTVSFRKSARSSMQNCDTNVISRSSWPRGFRAILRLFQIPEPPGGGPWGRLGPWRTALDSYSAFNPQTHYLSTLVHYPTQVYLPVFCPPFCRNSGQTHRG